MESVAGVSDFRLSKAEKERGVEKPFVFG